MSIENLRNGEPLVVEYKAIPEEEEVLGAPLQENVDPKQTLGRIAKFEIGAISFLTAASWSGGFLLFADRLNPFWQRALLVHFSTCVTLGTYYLYKSVTELAYHRMLPREKQLSLNRALDVLEKPVEDEKAGRMIQAMLTGNEEGDFSTLLLGSPERASCLDLLPKDLPVTVVEQSGEGVNLTNLTTERIEALERVLAELTDPEYRKLRFSHEKREEILTRIQSWLRSGNLFKHPEVSLLLKQVAVSGLKEGSPQILAEIVRTIGSFYALLAGKEKETQVKAKIDHDQALNIAVRAGTSIPLGLLFRKAAKGTERASFINDERFSPKELVDLTWVLAAVNLRPIPEAREQVKWAIPIIRGAILKLGSVDKLSEAREKILEILDFAEQVPNLDLEVSLHALARKGEEKLRGAAIDHKSADDLGLSEGLGFMTLITLPQEEEVSLGKLAQILTRTAIAYPFSSSFAILKGRLKIDRFKSHRVSPPTTEEMEMLFHKREVLDWLLRGRDPNELPAMDLLKTERNMIIDKGREVSPFGFLNPPAFV